MSKYTYSNRSVSAEYSNAHSIHTTIAAESQKVVVSTAWAPSPHVNVCRSDLCIAIEPEHVIYRSALYISFGTAGVQNGRDSDNINLVYL